MGGLMRRPDGPSSPPEGRAGLRRRDRNKDSASAEGGQGWAVWGLACECFHGHRLPLPLFPSEGQMPGFSASKAGLEGVGLRASPFPWESQSAPTPARQGPSTSLSAPCLKLCPSAAGQQCQGDRHGRDGPGRGEVARPAALEDSALSLPAAWPPCPCWDSDTRSATSGLTGSDTLAVTNHTRAGGMYRRGFGDPSVTGATKPRRGRYWRGGWENGLWASPAACPFFSPCSIWNQLLSPEVPCS